MKVLQFAFDDSENSNYLPHKYEKNCVCYTGTHDNCTTAGWVKTAPEHDVEFAKEYIGIKEDKELTKGLVKCALGSVSNLAIVPLQDWLELGDDARMNEPSTLGGNWEWRVTADQLTPALSKEIKRLTTIYGRLAKD